MQSSISTAQSLNKGKGEKSKFSLLQRVWIRGGSSISGLKVHVSVPPLEKARDSSQMRSTLGSKPVVSTSTNTNSVEEKGLLQGI